MRRSICLGSALCGPMPSAWEWTFQGIDRAQGMPTGLAHARGCARGCQRLLDEARLLGARSAILFASSGDSRSMLESNVKSPTISPRSSEEHSASCGMVSERTSRLGTLRESAHPQSAEIIPGIQNDIDGAL
jgi:hypothetical protein